MVSSGSLQGQMVERGSRCRDAFRAGEGVDQRAACAAWDDVPISVVNGSLEPYVQVDGLDGVHFDKLWESKCHRLEGLRHTPFWEDWEVFHPYLETFVESCSPSPTVRRNVEPWQRDNRFSVC